MRFRTGIFWVVIIAIFSMLSGSAIFADAENGHIVEIDKLINAYAEVKNFSGAVLVVESGETVYKKTVDAGNNSSEEQLNCDSVFFLGTFSKAFTGLAVMMLHEDGKLDYDDPVTNYFPKLKFYEEVTVRQVLNHISGIPDMFNEDSKGLFITKSVEGFLKKNKYFNYEPGRKITSNHTEYLLLARLVEKLSGMKYGDFLRKRIFEPAGMENSFSCDKKGFDKIPRISSKNTEGNSVEELLLIPGASCVFSSINDLEKFEKALQNNIFVGMATISEGFSQGVLNNGLKTRFGFGWAIVKAQESYNVGCSSKTGGFSCIVDRMVDYGHTAIVLNATGADYLPDMSLSALSILFGLDYSMPVPDEAKN